MTTLLPLKKMTTLQKLRAMEELWADLSVVAEAEPVPAWQIAAVRETSQRVQEGKEKLMPWEDAKKSIRRRAR